MAEFNQANNLDNAEKVVAPADSQQVHEKLSAAGWSDFKIKTSDDNLASLTLVDSRQIDDKSAKPENGDKQTVDVLKYLADMKADGLGPGLTLARQAAIDLRAEVDPAKAAAAYEDRVSKAITQSDVDYGDSVAKNWGGLSLARRDYMMKMSTFAGSVANLNASIKETPEEKQSELSGMVSLLQKDDLAPGLKSELRKEMGKYPEVLKNFDSAKAAEKEGKEAYKEVQKMQEPLLKAAGEQAATRYVMATLKEMEGKSGEAVLLKQEARQMFEKSRGLIIGEPVKAKPPLRV